MTSLRPISEASRAITLAERIIRMASPHRSTADLREITGASERHVQRVLSECCLPRRADRDPDTKWTEGMTADLERMWGQGLSHTAIGNALGVSRNSVAGKARRAGLPKRAVPANLKRGAR